MLKIFARVQVKHAPRVENSWADALEKLATASREDLGSRIPVEHLPEPSVNIENEEVSLVMSESSWMDPIWDYLVEERCPATRRRCLSLERSLPFLLFIGGPFISEDFLRPSLSA